MTPNEMREAKAQAISEAAQGLGWEALVEIKGYKFTVVLSAENATEQMIEGPLGEALKLVNDFGGPELYPSDETYDLVPLGVHDADKDLDEFVEELTESTNEFGELLSALDEFVEHDAGEEDTADAMCSTCNGEECGIPAWVVELLQSYPEPVEGEGWEVPMNGLHEDPEYGDGRYTFPKEVWVATRISDTPQDEYEHQHGGPTLAQPKEVEMSNENYVKDAVRTIANDGFVLVARKSNTRLYFFGSISNTRGAKYVKNGFAITAEPKARYFVQ